jgi:ribosomal protein L9
MMPLWVIRLIGYGLIFGMLSLGFHHLKSKYDNSYIDQGKAIVQSEWDADKVVQKAAEQKAIQDAIAKNESDHKTDLDATKQIEVIYAKSTSKIHQTVTDERNAVSASGLRLDRNQLGTLCNQLAASGKTASATGDNAAGDDSTNLPLTLTTSLLSIASDADEAVAMKDAKIKALQDWIVSHGFYK